MYIGLVRKCVQNNRIALQLYILALDLHSKTHTHTLTVESPFLLAQHTARPPIIHEKKRLAVHNLMQSFRYKYENILNFGKRVFE